MAGEFEKEKYKQIIVEMWGGRDFYCDPEEIKKARTDGEVLECLKDRRGIPPYSSVRYMVIAETPEGKKLVKELRRLCEGGRNKEKARRRVRKTAIDED